METIEGRITKTKTNFRKPLSPALKLAITIRYIAAGDSPIYTAFSPRRDEPGRTVAPPWRTGKNRSVTGVLPAWTWGNRGKPAREPG